MKYLKAFTVLLIIAALLTQSEGMVLSFTTSNTPEADCLTGASLYEADQLEEAFPLLRAATHNKEAFGFRRGYIECLFTLAETQYGLGKQTEALDTLLSALIEVEEMGLAKHIDISTPILLRINDIYLLQGQYDEAYETSQRLFLLSQQLNDQVRETMALNEIGTVLYYQGRYADASSSFQQALQLSRSIEYKDGEASSLMGMGRVYYALGEFREAIDHLLFAQGLWRNLRNRNSELETLIELGAVHRTQGDFDQAMTDYEAALQSARVLENRSNEAKVLAGFGDVYSEQGRYLEALQQYQQALVLLDLLFLNNLKGEILASLGQVYFQLGDLPTALTQYEQALEVVKELNNRAVEAGIYRRISDVYRVQGRYGEALTSVQRSLNIVEQMNDLNGQAIALSALANIYQAQGRFADALAHYQRASDIIQHSGNRRDELQVLLDIGSVRFRLFDYQNAIETYEKALQFARDMQDQDGEIAAQIGIVALYRQQKRYSESLIISGKILLAAQELGDLASEAAVLFGMGQIYDAQEEATKALDFYEQALAIQQEVGDPASTGQTLVHIAQSYEHRENIQQALDYYEQALTLFESIRAVAGNDLSRARFIEQHASLYNRVIELALQMEAYEYAFEVSERSRARAFLDSLATSNVSLSDEDDAQLLTREQELSATLQATRNALARARALQQPDQNLITEIETRLAETEAEYNLIVAEIDDRPNQLADFVPSRSRILSLHDIQMLLDVQTTLVSYQVLDKKTIAFIVAADSFDVVELNEAKPDAMRLAIANLHRWLNRENPYPRSLVDLHRWLVAPITVYLHTPHIAIVPHQLLHYIPFTALTDGELYFGERHTVSILPSANSLLYLIENAGQQAIGKDALVIGNPAVDDPDLPVLAYASKEASAIASLLGTTSFTEGDATESWLRTHVQNASILHIAAHGFYDSVNPLYSKIMLASDNEFDGQLYVREIFELSLGNTNLVTLSACETSIGQLSSGDELVGLTRAFFFAGTPTVISSLWQVDDAATEALMFAFYRHWLQGGMSKAKALQKAQSDVRAAKRWSSPYYWAGFVLNGYTEEHAGRFAYLEQLPFNFSVAESSSTSLQSEAVSIQPDSDLNLDKVRSNSTLSLTATVESPLFSRFIDNMIWHYYDKRYGIPGNVIHQIQVADDGKVWIGTDNGLAILQGRRWEIIPGTAGWDVSSFWTHKEKVWTTCPALLCTYDGSKWSPIEGANVVGIPHSIYVDEQENVWVGTRSSGVAIYSKGIWNTYDTRHGLPSNIISRVTSMARGQIVAVSSAALLEYTSKGGVAVFDGMRWRQHPNSPTIASSRSPFGRPQGDIWVDSHDSLWLVTGTGEGAAVGQIPSRSGVFTLKNGVWMSFGDDPWTSVGFNPYTAWSIAANESSVWVGMRCPYSCPVGDSYAYGGLVRYFNGEWRDYTVIGELQGFSVEDIWATENGVVWVASGNRLIKIETNLD